MSKKIETDMWLKGMAHHTSTPWYRVENSCMDGMPDLVMVTNVGHTVFVELKQVASVKRRHKLRLRPSQIGWIKNWIRHGGRALIVLFVENTGAYYLINPNKKIEDWYVSIQNDTAFSAEAVVRAIEDC